MKIDLKKGPNPQNPMMNSGQPQFQRYHSGGGGGGGPPQRPIRMPSNMEFNVMITIKFIQYIGKVARIPTM